MPVRWKIFRLVNYLQLIVSLIMLGLFTYTYVSFSQGEGFGYFVLFVFVLLMIIINNCLNVHIIHRYFPDKSFSTGKKTLLISFLVLYLLIIIAVIIFAITAISEIRSRDSDIEEWDWIGMSVFAFYIVTGIYISVLQITLPGRLERNNLRHMEQLLDEIGNPE